MMRDLGLLTGLDALLQVVGGVAGQVVVDIGSGEGALARELAEQGAQVTGFDPLGPVQPWTVVGAGRFQLVRAGAEALPVAGASVDLVLFIYSLHHIPDPLLPGILAEARRVLRPTGRLYVAEPLPEGPSHEVGALYHDETVVRQRAAATLAACAPRLFSRHEQLAYQNRRTYRSFDEYAERTVASLRFNDFTEDQLRAPAVRARYDQVAAPLGGVFDQPVRVDLLRP